jgi:predicted Zn-dependent protease
MVAWNRHGTLAAGPSPAPELLAELHDLEAMQECGDLPAADARAEALLQRFPDVAVVLVEVARLRARQGRYDEAMELLHRDAVGRNVRFLNYKLCAPLRRVHRASA